MKPRASSLTQLRLKEALHYDPEAGIWTRLSNGRRAGCERTFRRSPPYLYIYVDGYQHSAGRLAWLYMTGRWPDGEVDHINRNSLDNRWDNLRDVPRERNEHNKGPYKNNKSGFKGVWFYKGRWYAAIRRNGTRRFLGAFNSPDQAGEAYKMEDAA